MATSGFLKFKIGDFMCALPTTAVREILPMVELARPPRQPRVLEGYLNLGGVAVPVLRLDRVLNLPERATTDADHLILVRHGAGTVAWVVERALELVRVEPGQLLTGEYQRLNPCVSAEIRGAGVAAHVLDVDRILVDVERRALDEFAIEAQKRFVGVRGDAA